MTSTADPAAAAAAAAAAATATTTTALTRPEGIPDAFWDDKEGVKFKDLLTERESLVALKADTDARLAQVPPSPDKYELKLPEGFKLPEGWQVDASDPAWKMFGEFAHAKKMTQTEFTEAAQLYTQIRINEVAARNATAKAELTKLGDNGTARITAAHNWIDAMTGDDAAWAKDIKATITNAGAVRFFENLQKLATDQGVTSFNGNGRVLPRSDGRPADFDTWSPVSRRAWMLDNPGK